MCEHVPASGYVELIEEEGKAPKVYFFNLPPACMMAISRDEIAVICANCYSAATLGTTL